MMVGVSLASWGSKVLLSSSSSSLSPSEGFLLLDFIGNISRAVRRPCSMMGVTTCWWPSTQALITLKGLITLPAGGLPASGCQHTLVPGRGDREGQWGAIHDQLTDVLRLFTLLLVLLTVLQGVRDRGVSVAVYIPASGNFCRTNAVLTGKFTQDLLSGLLLALHKNF